MARDALGGLHVFVLDFLLTKQLFSPKGVSYIFLPWSNSKWIANELPQSVWCLPVEITMILCLTARCPCTRSVKKHCFDPCKYSLRTRTYWIAAVTILLGAMAVGRKLQVNGHGEHPEEDVAAAISLLATGLFTLLCAWLRRPFMLKVASALLATVAASLYVLGITLRRHLFKEMSRIFVYYVLLCGILFVIYLVFASSVWSFAKEIEEEQGEEQ